MPRRRQSLKAQRQTKKRHTYNVKIKTDIKKTLKELQAKDAAGAKDLLKKAISKLAKAGKKGILHKNTAARKIARISKKFSKLATATK